MSQPSFVLFLDENHCNNRHLLRVLEERNIAHERYSAYFSPGMPDIEWLPIVGEKGWCLLTTDKRMRYRALEKEAVRANKVRMYCFSTNNMNGRDIAIALNLALHAMLRLFNHQMPPFIAMITKSGSVHIRKDFRSSEVEK